MTLAVMGGHDGYNVQATAAIAAVTTFLILFTIFGNVLVIIAVLTSRSLKAPQNLFLVSLAAADILVATLIIPFSLANELMGYWYFDKVWCKAYLALDVLFCTASIVHLCAISLDRYWSVSQAIEYNSKRTPRRIKCTILVVWLLAALISLPPLVFNPSEAQEDAKRCELNEQPWYILSSSTCSFFAPCLIMILVYVRIYFIAKRRSRKGAAPKKAKAGKKVPRIQITSSPKPLAGEGEPNGHRVTVREEREPNGHQLMVQGEGEPKGHHLRMREEPNGHQLMTQGEGEPNGHHLRMREEHTVREEGEHDGHQVTIREEPNRHHLSMGEEREPNHLRMQGEGEHNGHHLRKREEHNGHQLTMGEEGEPNGHHLTIQEEPTGHHLRMGEEREPNGHQLRMQGEGEHDGHRMTIQEDDPPESPSFVSQEGKKTKPPSPSQSPSGKKPNLGPLRPESRSSNGPPPSSPLGMDTLATAKGEVLLVRRVKTLSANPWKRKTHLNREKRFTFVLAVVIGVFVICWFPFFFLYSLRAVCSDRRCPIPDITFKFFFWIGYCNSSLNPVIYTIFNQDFRKAFRRILCRQWTQTAW